MRGRLVLAICLTVLIAGALAGAPLWAGSPTFPKPTGYVNDFAHLLDPAAHASLEQRLAEYDRTTGNQIAIATFPDLGGVPINEFASRLEEAWKLGRRGKDNGVLLLVGVKERQVRIELGYGLEGKITDGDAGAIIRNILAPAFRVGRYADGLNAAVDQLMRLTGGAAGGGGPAPTRQRTRGAAELWVPFAGFLVFIALSVMLFRSAGPRCPRDRTRLRLQQETTTGTGAVGGRRISMWVCPRCGYREKAVDQGGPMGVPGPIWLGGGWGSGGFSGGGGGSGSGGFGGFGGGSSGGGGASGGW